MKHFEFEVVVPTDVFRHVTSVAIDDLLSWFDVHFECKGYFENKIEYLVTAPTFEVARAVRCMLLDLRRVVLVSAYDFVDKQRVKSWCFGEIREINS